MFELLPVILTKPVIGHALWLLLPKRRIGRPNANGCQAVVVITVMVDVLATVVVNTAATVALVVGTAAAAAIVDVAAASSVVHESRVVQLRRYDPVGFLFSGH